MVSDLRLSFVQVGFGSIWDSCLFQIMTMMSKPLENKPLPQLPHYSYVTGPVSRSDMKMINALNLSMPAGAKADEWLVVQDPKGHKAPGAPQSPDPPASSSDRCIILAAIILRLFFSKKV